MAIASKTVILALVFALALTVGGIFLQVFLSRREARWPGLVLPLVAFVYALLAVYQKCAWGLADVNIAAVFTAWLACNIPTLILLAVYWAVREKRRVQSQLDKMNIDDL